jgi:hypothetical protein
VGLSLTPSFGWAFLFETMKVIDTAHIYRLDDGQFVTFMKKVNGELVHEGATNEDLLAVLIDRIGTLNDKFPCIENDAAISHLKGALHWLNQRTATRVAQGVEGQDLAHKTPTHKIKYVVEKGHKTYTGGVTSFPHAYDNLQEAVAVADDPNNWHDHVVYELVEAGSGIQKPVWSKDIESSYLAALDQIDPLHDGVA